MNNTKQHTRTEVMDFWAYFDIADELYGENGTGVDASGYAWTVDDFDKSFQRAAKRAADASGLSWPPYRPEAEEFALSNKWVHN